MQPTDPIVMQTGQQVMVQPAQQMIGQPVQQMMGQPVQQMMGQPVFPMMGQPMQQGMGQPMQQGMGQPIGSAVGYQMLLNENRIQVRQLREIIEALIGIDTKDKFLIRSENGYDLFYAYETTNIFVKFLGGSCGPVKMNIDMIGGSGNYEYKNSRVSFLKVHQPFTCTICCFNRPQLTIMDGQTEEVLGRAVDPFACIDLTFVIQDPNGNDVLKSEASGCAPGICCPLPVGPCKEVSFPIKDVATGQEVGKLTKIWEFGEFCPLFFEEQDNYWIEFGQVSNAKWRALLLGLALYADKRYFSFAQKQEHQVF